VHAKNLQTVIERVRAKIASSGIHAHNLYWLGRYKKYGHDWMPDVFPLERGGGDFIFYRWPTDISADSTDAISRFPDWVALDVISEAADETVRGAALERCKQAHKLFDLAIIEAAAVKTAAGRVFDGSIIEIKRARPIILDEVTVDEKAAANRI
jgi:hypothetical protein